VIIAGLVLAVLVGLFAALLAVITRSRVTAVGADVGRDDANGYGGDRYGDNRYGEQPADYRTDAYGVPAPDYLPPPWQQPGSSATARYEPPPPYQPTPYQPTPYQPTPPAAPDGPAPADSVGYVPRDGQREPVSGHTAEPIPDTGPDPDLEFGRDLSGAPAPAAADTSVLPAQPDAAQAQPDAAQTHPDAAQTQQLPVVEEPPRD
jgi:hypothetical protein